MDDGSLCVEVCRQSGWLGEVVILLFFIGRSLYLQWRNRGLTKETASLQAKVVELESMRPPPSVPVSLQLPDMLVRALQHSLAPPPASSAPSSGTAPSSPSSSTPPPDSDYFDPPPDGS